MKEKIACPYCPGTAELKRQPGQISYRKEVFKVVEHFYKCQNCGEEFTTTESDTITLAQAYSQYRSKHNIPFPEEITGIKEKYQLSAAKMGEVLGLGVNSYTNFENGEMPSVALGKLIRTAENPVMFLTYLHDSRANFSDTSFEKTLNRVSNIIEQDKQQQYLSGMLNSYCESNRFTGYTRMNCKKVGALLSHFISESKPEYNSRLKLNKQFFYADFRHYKNYGRSITGLAYRAVAYGPVPAKYDNIFAYLENEQLINSHWSEGNGGNAVEKFTTSQEFDQALFSKEELETIEAVIAKFKSTSSWAIVELSHTERAWKELEKERKLIDYQEYAFDLRGV